MKIYKCDKCGRQIKKPKKVSILGEQKDPVIMMLQNMDLCDKCYEQIYETIDDYVTYKS